MKELGRRTFSRGAAERVAMVPTSPWWGEHRSRYHYAAKFVAGRRVIDVACGTGFGMNILSDAGAACVVGIDISRDALLIAASESARGVYPCRADALRLPVADAAADVITSFETLEHLDDDRRFVDELRRVLRPNGVLMLSTPNALHTRPVAGVPHNPFHVREYEPDELHNLLSQYFADVTLLGQHTHPRYPISPYWQLPEQLPRDLRGRSRVLAWKAQNRLPFSLKDRTSRLLHNRSFYPGEYDFVFEASAVAAAHVVVAICSR